MCASGHNSLESTFPEIFQNSFDWVFVNMASRSLIRVHDALNFVVRKNKTSHGQ